MISPENEVIFEADCMQWRGEILTGDYRHWCADWDELPVDETCDEFSCCHCFDENSLDSQTQL
jgi:hypothetical protein